MSKEGGGAQQLPRKGHDDHHSRGKGGHQHHGQVHLTVPRHQLKQRQINPAQVQNNQEKIKNIIKADGRRVFTRSLWTLDGS